MNEYDENSIKINLIQVNDRKKGNKLEKNAKYKVH